MAERPPYAWCRGPIPDHLRAEAEYCTKAHRQAAHRFAAHVVERARASQPMRIGYADPPYPGLAHRYYGDEPDYGGEVDHRELVARLDAGYDGWALSTSADALQDVLAVCTELGVDVEVASWYRGGRPARSGKARSAWEPVIYRAARAEVRDDAPEDALVYRARPRLTEARRVIGMKPAAFAFWVFELLGARPGDTFDDLFPGSGTMGRAWAIFDASPEYSRDASRLQAVDASPADEVDA